MQGVPKNLHGPRAIRGVLRALPEAPADDCCDDGHEDTCEGRDGHPLHGEAMRLRADDLLPSWSAQPEHDDQETAEHRGLEEGRHADGRSGCPDADARLPTKHRHACNVASPTRQHQIEHACSETDAQDPP